MGERILVVRIAGIGDVAVVSTVVERLRAEQSDAHITFLTGQAAAPLAKLYDGVDEVLAIDERALFRGNPAERTRTLLSLWTRLLVRRVDRVLLLHVDSRYRVLTLPLVRAKHFALTRAKHGEMLPVPARWLGDEYARLVDGIEHVGPIVRRFAMTDLRGKFPMSSARAKRRVVVVPGGARNVLRDDALRRWPVESYAQLCRLFAGSDVEVVIIGAESDRWVLPSFDDLPIVNRIGELDLVQTLALLRDSDLVISHDTGPMHLARLVRTPLVALFGPTIPAQVLSIDESVTVLWGGAHLACRPCFDGRDFARCGNNICLSSISPVEVFEAAQRRLASSPSPS